MTNPAGTLQIDTTIPRRQCSLVASGTGITAGTGDLDVGAVVTLTANMSQAVTVTGGTPTLSSTTAAPRPTPAARAPRR